ncbi:MAG: GDP-mannose 4,6-dehydratase [Verrucomicrobiaceae bacterium]|nr:GDP-mannose 4,6-dehydratase [Verrucomicrobiaceae bacterium]
MKRALITGITGQDGFYLAEYLLGLGYEVHGLARQTGLEHIKGNLLRDVPPELHERCHLHAINLDNFPGLFRLISQLEFHECYNLAASSFVGEKLSDGFATMHNNISSAHYLLGAFNEFQPKCRFYFAGSSEMFGRPEREPQDESTPMRPRSAYGISKLAGYHLMRNYREQYGMFCSAGLLYNHESPRRRPEFVTRKITMAVARIQAGKQKVLELGNLDAERDWGYAPDYVRAMHLILNHSNAGDFVVSAGQLHSVRELCEVAFRHAGLEWQDHVRTNPVFVRPEESVRLVGDSSKITRELGWRPQTSFEEMIREMVDADIAALS